MEEPPSSNFNLDGALAALQGRKSLLVYTHDNPDPDALAAALGLQRLAQHELHVDVTMAYGGIVGRAQNRAMVDNLKMGLVPIERVVRAVVTEWLPFATRAATAPVCVAKGKVTDSAISAGMEASFATPRPSPGSARSVPGLARGNSDSPRRSPCFGPGS